MLKDFMHIGITYFLLFVSLATLAFADQYFSTYYSYELDALVECFGNAQTDPFCVKVAEKNETYWNVQLYRERDFLPILQPQPTSIFIEEHQALQNYSTSATEASAFAAPPSYDELVFQQSNQTVFSKYSNSNITLDQTMDPGERSDTSVVIKNLVLLIQFPEHKDRFLYPASDFDTLFNGPGTDDKIIPTGSVKTFYTQQTYGKIILESTVMPWFKTSVTEKDAAGECSSLCAKAKLSNAITEALTYIESSKLVRLRDFDRNGDGWIDGFTVITSSAAAEAGGFDDRAVGKDSRIWSHKWSLRKTYESTRDPGVRIKRYSVNPAFFSTNPNHELMGRIGVIAHEIGHFLGLADSYDTTGRSAGLHVYDTMSSSWGVSGKQLRPNNFSPRNKNKLGVVNLKTPQIGRNVIRPSNGNSDNEIYAISGEAFGYDAKETIYIDYWGKSGYSAEHPGGILIYHADERVLTSNREAWHPGVRSMPHNGKHYALRLIQADGKFRLETEAWPKRYDPAVFWNSPELELSDFGVNNLMSWVQLEKQDLNECMTTGNYIHSFKKLKDDEYEFYYQKLPRQNCYKQLSPTDLLKNTYPTEFPTTAYPTGFPTKQTEYPTKYPTTAYPTRFPTVASAYPSPFPTVTTKQINFERATNAICGKKVNFDVAIQRCKSFQMRLCDPETYQKQREAGDALCAPQNNIWVQSNELENCKESSHAVQFTHVTSTLSCNPIKEKSYFTCC